MYKQHSKENKSINPSLSAPQLLFNRYYCCSPLSLCFSCSPLSTVACCPCAQLFFQYVMILLVCLFFLLYLTKPNSSQIDNVQPVFFFLGQHHQF